MNLFAAWRILNHEQRTALVAGFLGWALDAFDFFILVFLLPDIMKQFHASKESVVVALTLTLAMRPVGALLFGLAADKYGRRVPLMIDIVVYSILELATGFSPTLSVFLVLRALFGIGMGGEWGLGASLALESVPAETRGALSGVLQEGYPAGYLLASVCYFVAYPHVGWRGMFFIGAIPALLSLYIRAQVKESPVWLKQREARQNAGPSIRSGTMLGDIRKHLGLFYYLAVLMAAFNFMSHGTQDNYPNFLQDQHHFSHATVSIIAIIYNIGAIIGGVFFGALSQRIGRRKAIIAAAVIALPIIPLWAFAPTPALLATGAFLMQVMVQGAWGVIPAHLSELAPPAIRGTFTGFAYQCGNLIASVNSPLQVMIAAHFGGNKSLGLAMAIVVATTLLITILVTALGPEARGTDLSGEKAAA